MNDQAITSLRSADPSPKRPTPLAKSVYTEPSRFVLALRLGILTGLIAVAIAIMSFLASALSPAESANATTANQQITVQPLGEDMQTLAQSVIPNPPDLSPSTTADLGRAVSLVIKPAVVGDYGSALTNLEALQSDLNDAMASRTGTHVSRTRAAIIQDAIDAVRTDLQSLLEGNGEAA